MHPDEIEEMLYQKAMRTKIRPPLQERMSNLGSYRSVAGGLVAGMGLVFTLLVGHTDSSVSRTASSMSRTSAETSNTVSQMTLFQASSHQNDSATASLAMSPIGG